MLFILGRAIPPQTGITIHMRGIEYAIAEFAKSTPIAKRELLASLDTLYSEFKAMIERGPNIPRCDHGYGNPGNCGICRGKL